MRNRQGCRKGIGHDNNLGPELIAKTIRSELVLSIGEVEAGMTLVIGCAADAQVGAASHENIYGNACYRSPLALIDFEDKGPARLLQSCQAGPYFGSMWRFT